MTKGTAYTHCWRLKTILKYVRKPVDLITKEDLRTFLKFAKSKYKESTYGGFIKTLRVFFRDFLGKPQLVSTFKFPTLIVEPKILPTKRELQAFFHALEYPVMKALFLIYATSGLRTSEAIGLTKRDVDFKARMVIPKNHKGRSKRTWVTFYNEEAQRFLMEYLSTRIDDKPKLFRLSLGSDRPFKRDWRNAREKTGLNITPLTLRAWFADELSRLGVQDRYVDALCGRTPKTVLARHYSEYSP